MKVLVNVIQSGAKKLGSIKWCWVLGCFIMLFSACEHRELVEPTENVHYIRVYIDEQIKNVTCGFYRDSIVKPEYKRPMVLRAVLADPLSGKVVSERFLQTKGEDERGYYLEGYLTATPGDYHLMVYNYATETIFIRNEDNYHQMEGYTYQIAEHLKSGSMRSEVDGKGKSRAIHYEPDLLFLATEENIKIKESLQIDTLRTATGDHFMARTCTKSYYLQIRVKGIEYVSSIVSTLTGMGESVVLSTGMMGGDEEVGLYIPMHKGTFNASNETVVYATFNTFGKLPNVSSFLQVDFDFVTVDGRSVAESIDITSLFETKQVRLNQWILIDKEIVIDPPPASEGGGFQLGVGEWEQEDAEIII